MLVHDRPGCHQNDGFRGSQTTRITDRADRPVGSNRGQDLFKTLQFVERFDRSINGEKGPTFRYEFSLSLFDRNPVQGPLSPHTLALFVISKEPIIRIRLTPPKQLFKKRCDFV